MTHVPQDERAKVRLVSGGTDGAGPGTSPLGYTVLAEKMANLDGTVTFEESDYTNPLPNNGVIRAITYYEDPVQSNFSNSINVGLDTTPPTFGDVRGLQDIIVEITLIFQFLFLTMHMVQVWKMHLSLKIVVYKQYLIEILETQVL